MDDHADSTCNFDVCSKCRNICCQDAKPPLTAKRKKILEKYLHEQKIDISGLFSSKEYSFPSVDQELYCCLFDKNTGKCMVHPVKPETCTSGPITFYINFYTKKVEWFLKTKELCAYAGVIFADEDCFIKHFQTAKKQIMTLIGGLTADELRALMKIEEPQTFKFDENDLPDDVIKRLGLKNASFF